MNSAGKCRFFKTKGEREKLDDMATIARLTRKYGGKKNEIL